MSAAPTPVTIESVLELIRVQIEKSDQEAARRKEEFDRKLDRMVEAADRRQEAAEQEYARRREEDARRREEDARRKEEDARRKEEDARRQEKIDAQFEKTAKQIEQTNKDVGGLTGKVGNMVEKLVGEGNLVDQFRELGHRVKTHSRKKVFGEKGTADCGEIDLFLEDGNVAILVEAKTTLKKDDVIDHLDRMERYRRFVDADGKNGKHFIGAVAGTVIAENVIDFAHEKGLYVIIQSARAVEILSQPEGFVAKKW